MAKDKSLPLIKDQGDKYVPFTSGGDYTQSTNQLQRV